MSDWAAAIRARLAGAELDPARQREIVDEMVQHLEDRHAELLAGGAPPQTAESAVLSELDASGVLARRLREVVPLVRRDPPVAGAPSSAGALADLGHDLRYAARALGTSRGFTVVTLLSLALGIGANSAVFHFLASLTLRPLPVSAPDELALVRIRNWSGGSGSFGPHPDLTHPLWERLRARQQAFSGVLAWGDRTFNIAERGEARWARTLMVSGNYFHVLGVGPTRGRVFSAADDRPGCVDAGAVVSHGFWQRELGADPAVVGRRLSIEGRPVTIIGVTPPSFFGLEVGRAFDVAVPICMEAALRGDRSALGVPHDWWLSAMGRLRPGWTHERATAHFEAISPALLQEIMPPHYRGEEAERFRQYRLAAFPARTGISDLRRQYAEPLYFLLVIAGLVLLIACTNLTNLLLARARAREREIAVRLALGASRGRLVRQLMVESLVLAVLGAALGLLLARMLGQIMLGFLSTRRNEVFVPLEPDWRVLAFTTGLAGLTCVIFGLVPALRASRADVALVLKAAGGRSTTSGRERFGLRRLLVALQVALSFVLLFGALLFARSLRNLVTIDPGFREQGVLIARVDIRPLELPTERRVPFAGELLARLRNTPGVDGAAAANILPISGSNWNGLVWREGGDDADRIIPKFSRVSAGYFQTLGTRLVAGREFNDGDRLGSPKVAIINERLARWLGQGASVLGRRFRAGTGPRDLHVYEVIGVVRDTKYRTLREELEPIAFLPFTQNDDPPERIDILVRSDLPAASVAAALKQTLHDFAPAAIVELDRLERLFRQSMLAERLMATLAGFFGLLAALLAAIGLYGVVSYSVARRKRELGIRLALGAGAGRVSRMIVRESMELLVLGLVAGVALGLLAARTAAAMLYDLSPHDPLTLVMAAALMAAVTLLASALPARRAARADPLVALRDE